MMHGRLFTSGERACRGRPSSLRPWISPWTTFDRIVYSGNHHVRTLRCSEQYRAMSFAQLTYRESLRDIETCLAAQAGKLYQIGFRAPVRRSTLADANERRDWRIYADFAQRLIIQARKLYAGDSTLAPVLGETVYALDSTTIDLCLSVFPWASFRATKGAVKMHTLLDLCGPIPSFIHISDGKLHDVNVRPPHPGARRDLPHGPRLSGFPPAPHPRSGGRLLRDACEEKPRCTSPVLQAPEPRQRHPLRSKLDGPRTRTLYPDPLRRVRFRDSQANARSCS